MSIPSSSPFDPLHSAMRNSKQLAFSDAATSSTPAPVRPTDWGSSPHRSSLANIPRALPDRARPSEISSLTCLQIGVRDCFPFLRTFTLFLAQFKAPNFQLLFGFELRPSDFRRRRALRSLHAAEMENVVGPMCCAVERARHTAVFRDWIVSHRNRAGAGLLIYLHGRGSRLRDDYRVVVRSIIRQVD